MLISQDRCKVYRVHPVTANIANIRMNRAIDPRRTTTVNHMGAINEYNIDGVRYLLVTSLPEFDVVRCPDRTYAKVDRKAKSIIGPY